MLGLLVWTATFSLLAVGLILSQDSSDGLSDTEVSAACQNGVLNGITTNLTRISDACLSGSETETATTAAANAGTTFNIKGLAEIMPTFTLPAGWSGSAFGNYSHETGKAYASFMGTKGISFDCNECGGVTAPAQFSITSNPIGRTDGMSEGGEILALGSMDVATIEAAYKKTGAGFSDVSVTSMKVNNGTLVTINANWSDPGGVVAHAGPFHILRFQTATNHIEIYFPVDHDATESEWEFLKNSLDWSTIK